jgi:hypothetical protein
MDSYEMRKAFINSIPVDFVTSQLNNYIDKPNTYSVNDTVALVSLAVGLITRMSKELINEDDGSLQN